jgi:hypothetical protein
VNVVRCFGTENRASETVIEASADIYEFLIFRGKDIKDLHVSERNTPTARPKPPADPAIMSMQVTFLFFSHLLPSLARSVVSMIPLFDMIASGRSPTSRYSSITNSYGSWSISTCCNICNCNSNSINGSNSISYIKSRSWSRSWW